MKQNSQLQEKVVVIGSGIGGLSTAIILAKLGHEVTVLEKNSQPGGLMRSYRRRGLDCSVGVHYLGSLDQGQVLRKFFDFLGVSEKIGVRRMGEGGVVDRYLFNSPDTHPSHFDLPAGFDAYENNLKEKFPDDASCIDQIVGSLRKSAKQLHSLDFLYNDEFDFSLFDQVEPLGQVLHEMQCSPGLRSVLAIPSCWIGVPLEQCQTFYHNMALASYVSSSYRLEENGSAMASAFASRLDELGGEIVTNAEVDKILVDSRVVKGVQLCSGENVLAGTVIGALHPKVILKMLEQKDVKPSYRKRISSLKDTHGIFSVHVRVDREEHPAIPFNLFQCDTDSEGNVPDLRYYQIRRSEKKEYNLLSILTSGKEDMWKPWENTYSLSRGDDYQQLKHSFAQGLINEAEHYFGQLKNHKILDTYTPLTLRDWVNSPSGSAYGVQRSAEQTLATAMLNRTAVKGLLLAGQNVLAPGIIGTIMGSFSTVKLLLGGKEFSSLIDLERE